MAKRRKPDPVIIGNIRQAESALAELAEIDRSLTAVEGDMNETIDQVKANAKAEATPFKARRKELEDALAAYAQNNKAVLFGKKKSLDLGFGVIGFRLTTKLVAQAGVKLAMVLERVKEFGFSEAITTKESVNKDVMRDWPDERLSTVGMRRDVSDQFYYELKKEDLSN